MRNTTAGVGAIIAGFSLVAFVGSAVQYSPLDYRLLLFTLYIGVAVVAAVLGTGGALPGWRAPAVVALLAAVGGLALWPQANSWNYLFEPLLLTAAAAAASAAILWRGRNSNKALLAVPQRDAITALRPALIWSAAIALGAMGLLLLASFNPIGLGLVLSAVTLLIGFAVALRRATPRGVAIAAGMVATPVPVIALWGLLLATGTVSLDRRYEIPAAYRGWVVIEHLAPNCPQLRQDGPELVFPVDARGCGCTSSKEPEGFSRWTYVAVASDGTRVDLPQTNRGGGGLIWAQSGGSSTARPYPWEEFFVGTEDELQGRGDRFVQESRCLSAR